MKEDNSMEIPVYPTLSDPNASFSITWKKKDENGTCVVEAKCPRRIAEKMCDLWDDWYIEKRREDSYLDVCRKREK